MLEGVGVQGNYRGITLRSSQVLGLSADLDSYIDLGDFNYILKNKQTKNQKNVSISFYIGVNRSPSVLPFLGHVLPSSEVGVRPSLLEDGLLLSV